MVYKSKNQNIQSTKIVAVVPTRVKKGRMVKNIRCIPTKSITMTKMIAKINVLLTINARASNLRRRRVVRYGIKNRRNREPIKKKMRTVTGKKKKKKKKLNIKSTKIGAAVPTMVKKGRMVTNMTCITTIIITMTKTIAKRNVLLTQTARASNLRRR